MDSQFVWEFLSFILKRTETLQIAHQANTDFISKLSYELRTPLTSIVGMAQLLNMDHLLPTQKKCVSDILNASEHMLHLVDATFSSTRFGAGQIKLKQETFDFKHLLQEVVDIILFHAHAKGLQLALDYGEDVPIVVKGDKHLIRQIALNWLGRALKSTEQGSIIIQVRCIDPSMQTMTVAFSIQDTGHSLSEESLKQIKLLSATEHNRYHYSDGVIDFGLMIAAKHLKLMQAPWEIESVYGRGTRIIAYIPFEVPLSAVISIPKRKQVSLTVRANSHRKLCILLVEDNHTIQKVYNALLSRMQARVVLAPDAKTALSFYKQHHYDLILMDIGLPDQSGIEAAREIRYLDRGKRHIPIIALTAYAEQEDTQMCLAAGIDEVVVKPIHLADLSRLIERWVYK